MCVCVCVCVCVCGLMVNVFAETHFSFGMDFTGLVVLNDKLTAYGDEYD